MSQKYIDAYRQYIREKHRYCSICKKRETKQYLSDRNSPYLKTYCDICAQEFLATNTPMK